jgi:hypothetical protein
MKGKGNVVSESENESEKQKKKNLTKSRTSKFRRIWTIGN